MKRSAARTPATVPAPPQPLTCWVQITEASWWPEVEEKAWEPYKGGKIALHCPLQGRKRSTKKRKAARARRVPRSASFRSFGLRCGMTMNGSFLTSAKRHQIGRAHV